MEAAGETEGRTERAEPRAIEDWRYQRTSKLREPRVKVDTLRSLIRLTHAVKCRALGAAYRRIDCVLWQGESRSVRWRSVNPPASVLEKRERTLVERNSRAVEQAKPRGWCEGRLLNRPQFKLQEATGTCLKRPGGTTVNSGRGTGEKHRSSFGRNGLWDGFPVR